jgi:hypothetical protein
MTKIFLICTFWILLGHTSYMIDKSNLEQLDNSNYASSTTGPAKIVIVNPPNISDTISYRATDLIKDFEIIKLETKNESLIDNIMRCYVGEK